MREFAAQANDIATRILNWEIDIDTARAYSAAARLVAQAVTAEVKRAQQAGEEPDLSLEP